VAERQESGDWHVNQWAKKAVLLGFRIKDMEQHDGGPQGGGWWDKVDSKFKGWGDNEWKAAGFRAVPNCVVRKSAYIAPGVVLMPSFVNLGAYVDEGTMVDTWATVGSCAQIGKNVHLSGGVGIGGVLEPMQAGPTIIEDNCFIGARSEVVEGCIVREGSVLGMGVYIGKSTKIVDRETGEVLWRGAALFGRGLGLHAHEEQPQPLLRRDRETGGCADALQDRDQRASARLRADRDRRPRDRDGRDQAPVPRAGRCRPARRRVLSRMSRAVPHRVHRGR
jgi:tetrahydrodipicolinate N-succinyltransferase